MSPIRPPRPDEFESDLDYEDALEQYRDSVEHSYDSDLDPYDLYRERQDFYRDDTLEPSRDMP